MLGESLVLVFSADSILGDVFLLVLVSFLMAAGFPGLLSVFGATSFLLQVIFFKIFTAESRSSLYLVLSRGLKNLLPRWYFVSVKVNFLKSFTSRIKSEGRFFSKFIVLACQFLNLKSLLLRFLIDLTSFNFFLIFSSNSLIVSYVLI